MGSKFRGVRCTPNFQRPLAAKLCVDSNANMFWRSKKGTDLLYHHVKFAGAWISHAAEEQKKFGVFIFVFVGYAFE